jgi:bifunctional non-homologous end joining protein LigD
VPPISFMLAERGVAADLDRLASRGFWFDLKIDGIRALVTLTSPQRRESPVVSMTSRNRLDLTGRYPELRSALEQVLTSSASAEDVVLDAEIAVPGRDGLPSWPLTHRRTAQRYATPAVVADVPAVLYVFDVLRLGDADMRQRPWRERRAVLDALASTWPDRITATPISREPAPLWQLVVDNRLEGVIAKNPESRYVTGRSRDWVKIKATQSLSCLVGGVEWAPDVANEPRSLQLYLVNPEGDLVPVGKASAGVSPALRPALRDGIRHPPMIVEVEYTQVTPGNVLRNPVVRAVRTDLDVLDCTTDQLAATSAG